MAHRVRQLPSALLHAVSASPCAQSQAQGQEPLDVGSALKSRHPRHALRIPCRHPCFRCLAPLPFARREGLRPGQGFCPCVGFFQRRDKDRLLNDDDRTVDNATEALAIELKEARGRTASALWSVACS